MVFPTVYTREIIAVKEFSIPQIRATIEDLMVFCEKQSKGKWLSEVSPERQMPPNSTSPAPGDQFVVGMINSALIEYLRTSPRLSR